MENSHLPITLPLGYRLQNWYRIDRVLGRGPCGVTYQAYDCNLERPVAIKEYLPTALAIRDRGVFVEAGAAYGDDAYHIGLEAFLDEARILAKVEHPNTPSIINVFVAQNTAYVVMTYEEGESLEAVLQQGRMLEEAKLTQLLLPLLSLLEKVHEAGHIHGDIQPAHILLRSDGTPVLVDFGATRGVVAELTHSAINISPGYSAPEAYFGKRAQLGASADLYGLAATLYRAVAGVAPPDALQRSQGMIGDSGDPFLPSLQIGGQRYSENLLQAIDCALNLDAGQRPQSIAAWRREFGSSPTVWPGVVPTRPEAPPTRSSGFRASHPEHHSEYSRGRYITGGVLALAVGGLITQAWLNRHAPINDHAAISEHPAALAAARPTTPSGHLPATALPHSDTPAMPSPTAEALSGELDKSVESRIAALLTQARTDLRSGHWISPKDDNALVKYRTILALNPSHSEANDGLERIADEFLRMARNAMEKHDWDLAQQNLDSAGSVMPGLDRLETARRELHARQWELSRQQQTAGKTAGKTDNATETTGTATQLATSARKAIAQQQWENAESAIARIEALTPRAAELPKLRRALNDARPGTNEPAHPGTGASAAQARAVQALFNQARRAMNRRQWQKAQACIDKAAGLSPPPEEIALLQGELNFRQAAGEDADNEQKSSAPVESAGTGENAASNQAAAEVKIQSAAVSLPTARPGQTVEFVTDFVLTLPAGESDRPVTSTWALTRDGRRVGQNGATSILAKSGPHSTSTQLMVPPSMKAGIYVVEHRVEAGRSRDVAQSSFRVQPH